MLAKVPASLIMALALDDRAFKGLHPWQGEGSEL